MPVGQVIITEVQPILPSWKRWSAGEQLGLTRVQRGKLGCEVSTIRNNLNAWYETVVFPLEGETPMEPRITETRADAESTHNFSVKIATQLLQPPK